MKYFLAIACLLSLSCASAGTPVAADAIDRAEVDDAWSLHVVTLDPNGDERVTRIWIAVVHGQAAIRTNQSRWWSNLERDPRVRIRLSGTDYPFQVESVTDLEGRIRIDEVFLEKYGIWERMMFPQDRGQTHDNYARLLF